MLGALPDARMSDARMLGALPAPVGIHSVALPSLLLHYTHCARAGEGVSVTAAGRVGGAGAGRLLRGLFRRGLAGGGYSRVKPS